MPPSDPGVSNQDLEQLCSLFRLLSDTTRLSILMRLGRSECNVTTLCEELNLPQPTISHHLGLLRMNNLVASRRYGKQVYYILHGGVDPTTVMRFNVQNLTVHVYPVDHKE